MLAIRMQRVGRKGHPMYRVIVQEARRQPTSGRIVANIGSYDPHTKATTLDKEKVALYLKNGAQPSDRVIKLLKSEKVALPDWVKQLDVKKQKSIKNIDKLRANRPPEETEPAPAEPAETETPEKAEEPEVAETAEVETPVVEAETEAPVPEVSEPVADTAETAE